MSLAVCCHGVCVSFSIAGYQLTTTSCHLTPLGQECWHSFTRSCSGLSARSYLRTQTHPRKGSRSLSCLADFTPSVALESLASLTADQGFLQLPEASDPMQPLSSQKSVLLSLKWTRRRSLASVFQQGRELLLVWRLGFAELRYKPAASDL